jgi:DNA glycosylase AlkZ-like
VTDKVLGPRQLNRALLARQLLLARADMPIPEALEQVGGLQTQYAPSGYVGLWSRLEGFQRASLTQALEDRVAVQATLLRATIHLVSAREFWRYALGVRRARRDWWSRLPRTSAGPDATVRAEQLRAALADGPRTAKDLGELASGFLGHVGLWVDLVRVPPSGTWERRRADRLALADQWLGPEDASEIEGVRHLVRAYLRAFGPATWKDISAWAGVPVGALKEAAADLPLVTYRDEGGGLLLDLPHAPLPDPDTPAPVRFLPHWDASLLAHARRAGILPEAYRTRVFSTRNPFSVGTVLVDGRVVAAWSTRDGGVQVEAYEPLPARVQDEIAAECARLEAFQR